MNDEYFMEIALSEAWKAFKKDEVPIGAVLVHGGKIIAKAYNQPIKSKDPTAHAEITALRKGAKKIKNYRLENAVLYCTAEPCIMCLGAIIHARVRRVVYGVEEPKFGAVCSIINFPFDKFNYNLEIKSGVLAEKCSKILKEFFKRKRNKFKT